MNNVQEYWRWLSEQLRLNELARTTKSVDTLKELATLDDWAIRHNVMSNRHSTEDVLLLVHAYHKFKKLKI